MHAEQTYIAKNGTKVIYKHKKRKYDFNHVIFVFSGFLNAKPGNYDFANALNDCPCDVVWICDNFEEMYTYYLCIDMDFRVENAVSEFINQTLNELGLTHKQATVTGFSKGGSAALYYGLKYNFANIVTTVPQFHIGSYVNNNWKQVAGHMMGKGRCTTTNISYLDKLLPKLLKQDNELDKNIYLLTSEADIQYKPEIEPYLADFTKYKNFNLLKTYSAFVREHNQVTGHHTALLLGIYYALASEAIPRYGDGVVNFFGSQPHSNPKPSGTPFVDLRVLKLAEDRLFMDGVVLMRGYDAAGYGDLDYALVLNDSGREQELLLAKGNQPYLTKSLFDGEYLTIYDKAVFTTYQHKGIDLTSIERGKYQLFIKITMLKHDSIIATERITSAKDLPECKNDKYRVFKDEQGWWLEVC